jgi:RHS repeat-associated protein
VRRRASCLFLLAAILWWGGLSALAIRPDFQETRVGGCEVNTSGQTSAAGSQTVENAMGCEGCGYKSASGQWRWPNHDPIGETGGINLYGFVGNSPEYWVDTDGRGLWGTAIGSWVGGGLGILAGGTLGTLALPVGGTIAGADALGAAGLAAGAAIGNAIGNLFGPSPPVPTVAPPSTQAPAAAPPVVNNSAFPPGYWPGDKGAAAWGVKNGVGAREGKGRFHGIKQKCKGSKATDKYGVNPDTGDVMDPEGQSVGNLDDVKSK